MPKVGWVMLRGFVANFTGFPAVQKFWKSVKIWQSYREFKGGNFFETQCIAVENYQSTDILLSILGVNCWWWYLKLELNWNPANPPPEESEPSSKRPTVRSRSRSGTLCYQNAEGTLLPKWLYMQNSETNTNITRYLCESVEDSRCTNTWRL